VGDTGAGEVVELPTISAEELEDCEDDTADQLPERDDEVAEDDSNVEDAEGLEKVEETEGVCDIAGWVDDVDATDDIAEDDGVVEGRVLVRELDVDGEETATDVAVELFADEIEDSEPVYTEDESPEVVAPIPMLSVLLLAETETEDRLVEYEEAGWAPCGIW